jgi:hypothetical protein
VPSEDATAWPAGPLNETLADLSGAPTGVSLVESTNENRKRLAPTASSDEMMTGRTDALGPLDGTGDDDAPAAEQPAASSAAHRVATSRSRGMATA